MCLLFDPWAESPLHPTTGLSQDEPDSVYPWDLRTAILDSSSGNAERTHDRHNTVCRWIFRNLPSTYSARRVGVCHFERSTAQSRNLASNMARRPFPTRFLRAAFGLGRNDNGRPSIYEVFRSNQYKTRPNSAALGPASSGNGKGRLA